jgi:hypothetical protein
VDEPPNQWAYIGSFPLCPGQSDLSIWPPLNFSPLGAGRTGVKFAVTMAIIDSTTNRYDCFRWSFYSTNNQRLFTIDFDNADFRINYWLEDGTNFVSTGRFFTNGVIMDLQVEMDFAQNRWRAFLDGSVLATNQPITRGNVPLHLDHIAAMWAYGNPSAPGDNFMLFDNYSVTASGPGQPPRLTPLGLLAGQFLLRAFGEPGCKYAVEVSTNLQQWTAIKTNTATDGSFDFLDSGSVGRSQRFYRARLVP